MPVRKNNSQTQSGGNIRILGPFVNVDVLKSSNIKYSAPFTSKYSTEQPIKQPHRGKTTKNRYSRNGRKPNSSQKGFYNKPFNQNKTPTRGKKLTYGSRGARPKVQTIESNVMVMN